MLNDIHTLIERCIQREERAWMEFINKFSGLLYYSVRTRFQRARFSYREEDVEDIVQTVFLELLDKNRLSEVREREKITAYLSIVSQTRALNYIKKKKEFLLREEDLSKIDMLESEPSSPEQEVMQKLEKLIEGFDAKEKIICKLNILHGKTHREIASFMNISINTVSTIVARKKKILRDLLDR
ncbi:MAG: sigma-70 family RNA polymerase sigma factor [Candidatus Omnitrophota bacterium]|jgi:RNA polymerase sigma-70 factor (ECF subfamily)|nr:sigma-70 family RNA polymerase sigma factor [Candidatus Omnitrophota bacterium]